MGLPDHQDVELGPCGVALLTRVTGGAVVSYPCGFETFRAGAERPAAWRPVDVEQFLSDRLPVKAPL